MTLDQIDKYGFSKLPDPANRIFSLSNDNANALLLVWLFMVTKNGFLTDIDTIMSGNGQPTFIDVDALSDISRLAPDTIKSIFSEYTDPSVPEDVRTSFQKVARVFQTLADSLSNKTYRPDQYADAGTIYNVCKEGANIDPAERE
jgi:hypothetical protein